MRITVLASPLALALACTHADDRRADREYRRGNAPEVASQPGEETIEGRIREVTSRTITISSRDADRTLRVDRQTSISVDDQPAGLGDLQPGQEVRASYAVDADGRRMALRIESRGGTGPYGYGEGMSEHDRR